MNDFPVWLLVARAADLASRKEWHAWSRDGRPTNMPTNPDRPWPPRGRPQSAQHHTPRVSAFVRATRVGARRCLATSPRHGKTIGIASRQSSKEVSKRVGLARRDKRKGGSKNLAKLTDGLAVAQNVPIKRRHEVQVASVGVHGAGRTVAYHTAGCVVACRIVPRAAGRSYNRLDTIPLL